MTPVDSPPVSSEDLRALLEAPVPSVLSYKGCPGHPVCLGTQEMHRLKHGNHSDVAGEVGSLRELLVDAELLSSRRAEVLLNFNRPEDWNQGEGADISYEQ